MQASAPKVTSTSSRKSLTVKDRCWRAKYLIKCDSDESTWEPRGNLHPVDIADFEKANGLFDFQWWRHRCPLTV